MFHTKVLLLVFSFLCSTLITSGESMGNITSLTRNGLQDGGTSGKVNQLTYGYDGNRLVSVCDAVTSPTYNGFFGFSDGADQAVEYEYDANGNMTRDRNKGISSIQYNADNLPLRIQYDNGSRATYLYTADGTKLQVRYETSYAGLLSSGPPSGSASTAIAQTHTIDYIGNKIYEDGTLKKILVDGGYVEYNGGSPVYHAYLTDHQGNVRVVVSENATVKQVNHYYPYGGLMAESTGGDVQRYKYNGKELDRMHGLDWYDHGARHNDAAIGRWHSMDEKCEKYYDVSPYAYCMDNPINRIDPDGRDTYLYARQLNAFLPMSLGVHTFIVVNILGKEPQYFSYGPSGKYLGTLTRTYYKDDIDIYTHADKTLQYEAIKITPPEGMSEIEFDNNVIKAANSFYEDSNVRYDILSPSGSLDTGNCNSSTSTLLNKAGISKEKIDEIKENIPGNSYGFGDIKPWTKEEKDKLEKK